MSWNMDNVLRKTLLKQHLLHQNTKKAADKYDLLHESTIGKKWESPKVEGCCIVGVQWCTRRAQGRSSLHQTWKHDCWKSRFATDFNLLQQDTRKILIHCLLYLLWTARQCYQTELQSLDICVPFRSPTVAEKTSLWLVQHPQALDKILELRISSTAKLWGVTTPSPQHRLTPTAGNRSGRQ